MKIRQGFVSNSSSSSFIVARSNFNDRQLANVHDHLNVAEALETVSNQLGKFGFISANDAWEVSELTKGGIEYIQFYTTMNNFDMEEFLKEIGIMEDDIIWT